MGPFGRDLISAFPVHGFDALIGMGSILIVVGGMDVEFSNRYH
jgi:hypothetical protein